MEKKIEDYLHLYIGHEAVDIEYPEEGKFTINLDSLMAYETNLYPKLSFIKPILRPLSDMTEEEKGKYNSIYDRGFPISSFRYREPILDKMHPLETLYLLKQGFDLFGLISAGLAINKTTLNK